MTDTITKSKRISSKEAGLKWGVGISPKYWEKQKEQRERWAREDAIPFGKETTIITNVVQPKHK